MSDGGSKKDDPKKAAAAVDRSRLNAELAMQFSHQPGRAPGRRNRRDEEELGLVPDELEAQEATAEKAAEQQNAEQQTVEAAAREPKKSLFALPRKEPTRQPLIGSPFTPSSAGTAAANSDAPAPPPPRPQTKPKP